MTTTIVVPRTVTTVVTDACIEDYIFQDDFSGGNLDSWDGVSVYGSGTIQVVGGECVVNCPNGNNEMNPPPEDEAVAYINIVWPDSNILWAKCDIKVDSAGTDINIGGGFFLEFCSALDLGAAYVNRWNLEFYSPAQEPGSMPSPYNGEYPFKICGNQDDGVHRIHANIVTWINPDTWYEVWIKVDYSGTNPTASLYINGTFIETITDTVDLSVNCTKPPYLRIGQPWYDDAAKVKCYIDNFALSETEFVY
jgi:hypothetical protein